MGIRCLKLNTVNCIFANSDPVQQGQVELLVVYGYFFWQKKGLCQKMY